MRQNVDKQKSTIPKYSPARSQSAGKRVKNAQVRNLWMSTKAQLPAKWWNNTKRNIHSFALSGKEDQRSAPCLSKHSECYG